MAGITEQGFVTKTYAELLEEMRNRARTLFADKVEVGDVVDVSDSTLLGRLINLDVTGDADLWQLAQQCWLAFDPNSATGISLDNLVQYSGIARFQPSASTVSGLFAGDNGTLIPDGSVVKSVDNNDFNVIGSVALSPSQAIGVTLSVASVANSANYSITYTSSGSSATATYTSSVSATASEILNGLQSVIASTHPLLTATVVGETLVVDLEDVFQTRTFSITPNLSIVKVKKIGQLQSTQFGAIAQEANTITQISTPVLGWDSITNPLAASVGRLVETDEELRLRFRNTKLERSSNILDSLYSALLNLDGVDEVAIYENDTDVTNAIGVLPHGFIPVVLGGSSQLIAETIWKNKPIGIRSQGNTEIDILDSQGFSHTVGFERPNPVDIYITMSLTIDANTFPGDGAEQIRQAITSYASANFGVGKEIIYSRLFTPINSIAGHQINSLFIGTSVGPTGTSNIPVAFNEIGSFQSVNIVVNL